MRHQIGPPIDPLRKFVNAEVIHCRRGMHRCDGAERACRVVGRRPDVVLAGEIGDTLGLEQATRLRDDNVDAGTGLVFDQWSKPMEGV
jgi:hypothetical protein